MPIQFPPLKNKGTYLQAKSAKANLTIPVFTYQVGMDVCGLPVSKIASATFNGSYRNECDELLKEVLLFSIHASIDAENPPSAIPGNASGITLDDLDAGSFGSATFTAAGFTQIGPQFVKEPLGAGRGYKYAASFSFSDKFDVCNNPNGQLRSLSITENGFDTDTCEQYTVGTVTAKWLHTGNATIGSAMSTLKIDDLIAALIGGSLTQPTATTLWLSLANTGPSIS